MKKNFFKIFHHFNKFKNIFWKWILENKWNEKKNLFFLSNYYYKIKKIKCKYKKDIIFLIDILIIVPIKN